MEAYRLYLRGRHHWNRRPRESLKGLEYFQRAIARDPLFALAHAGIADVYNTLGSWEAAYLPSWEAFPRARAAAAKALEIDPALAEARTSLAYAQTHYLWQLRRGGATVLRGIGAASDILPRASLALAPAHGDGTRGRIADREPPRARARPARHDHQRASRLAPLDRARLGQRDRGMRAHARDRRAGPLAALLHGLALGLRGEPTLAVDELRRSLTLSGDSPVMLGALGWGLAMAGSRDEARVTSSNGCIDIAEKPTGRGLRDRRHRMPRSASAIRPSTGSTAPTKNGRRGSRTYGSNRASIRCAATSGSLRSSWR